MLTATKTWHCTCCDEEIKPGDKFYIVNGNIFKKGHPKKKVLDRPVK
jgi:hypothetical protein